MDTRKLFKTFEESYDADKEYGQSMGDYFAERMEEAQETLRHVRALDDEERRLKESYEKDQRELKKRRAAIQESCSHPATTYYPDASGNNDSHTECDICGIEVARRSLSSPGYDG